MKRCPFCKGPIAVERIEHVHQWRGTWYLLRNVPAEVCAQCGETFFAPDVLAAMDRVVSTKSEPDGHVYVPVFSLSDR